MIQVPVTKILVNGETFEVEVLSREREHVRFRLEGREYQVEFAAEVPQEGVSNQPRPAHRAARSMPAADKRPETSPGKIGSHQVLAPIPGVVVDVLVSPGDAVTPADPLLRIEAMKMQNSIFSPVSGTVAAVHVQAGDEVRDSQLLVDIN